MKNKINRKIITGIVSMSVLLAGCGRVEPVEGIENYVAEVSDITVPDEVKITTVMLLQVMKSLTR